MRDSFTFKNKRKGTVSGHFELAGSSTGTLSAPVVDQSQIIIIIRGECEVLLADTVAVVEDWRALRIRASYPRMARIVCNRNDKKLITVMDGPKGKKEGTRKARKKGKR